jgi:chitin disaccharide deacetylase
VRDPRRLLVVNADDFGRSRGVNAGVARAHERGIVTSASLMVRWPAAVDAAEYARAHPRLGVGLHVDLAEWSYRDGDWVVDYEVVDTTNAVAVRTELDRQLARFRELLERPPTHLDSHQHAHRDEPLRSALLEHGRRLGVPVRDLDARVRFCGAFYGQTGRGDALPEAITAQALAGLIASLPPGCTEIACHPAVGDDLASDYRAERSREVEALCHPAARAAVARTGVVLASFADALADPTGPR